MSSTRGTNTFFPGRVSSLHLDYGTDAEACGQDAVEFSERGLRLRSRWRFEIGTQLAVSFVHDDPRTGLRRLQAEGMVVWCEALAHDPKMYESTLLFLEIPDELKQCLRDFSYFAE